MQSVELLLDASGHDLVLAQWTALADAGLPSQLHHHGATNAPHVTIGLATAVYADAEARLEHTTTHLPVPLSLGPPLLFGEGKHVVLARMVLVTEALLGLHRSVTHALQGCPGQIEHVAVGRWVPHVTLAQRIDPDLLGAALRALAPAGGSAPIDAVAVTIRRWDPLVKKAWDLMAPSTP